MLPEGDESPEKITYQAASPDEAALVTAAKNFGFFFYRFVIFISVRRHVKKHDLFLLFFFSGASPFFFLFFFLFSFIEVTKYGMSTKLVQ